ncbi:MAG: hypothetical protein WC867_05305 [Candidatus Pacearchaeota archaeon]|jgi:hypothetical protein
MKKGQISIFIILGIIILISILLLFIFSKKDILNEKQKELNYLFDKDEFFQKVNNCIDKSTLEAVQIVGLKGGYFEAPENSLKTENLEISYALIEGKINTVSLEEMSNQLKNYIVIALPICFSENSDYNINELETPVVEVEINYENINFKINFPITVNNFNNSVLFNDVYTKTLDIDLGNVYKTEKIIVSDLKNNPDFIQFTKLSRLDHEVEITPYKDGIFIYTIVSKTKESQLNTYYYRFAVKP